MNELGTIEHDYRTPTLDSDRRHAEKVKQEGRKYKLAEYTGEFRINPNWCKCYGGTFRR